MDNTCLWFNLNRFIPHSYNRMLFWRAAVNVYETCDRIVRRHTKPAEILSPSLSAATDSTSQRHVFAQPNMHSMFCFVPPPTHWPLLNFDSCCRCASPCDKPSYLCLLSDFGCAYKYMRPDPDPTTCTRSKKAKNTRKTENWLVKNKQERWRRRRHWSTPTNGHDELWWILSSRLRQRQNQATPNVPMLFTTRTGVIHFHSIWPTSIYTTMRQQANRSCSFFASFFCILVVVFLGGKAHSRSHTRFRSKRCRSSALCGCSTVCAVLVGAVSRRRIAVSFAAGCRFRSLARWQETLLPPPTLLKFCRQS